MPSKIPIKNFELSTVKRSELDEKVKLDEVIRQARERNEEILRKHAECEEDKRQAEIAGLSVTCKPKKTAAEKKEKKEVKIKLSYYTSRNRRSLSPEHKKYEIQLTTSSLKERLGRRQNTTENRDSKVPTSYYTSRKRLTSPVKHEGCEIERPKHRQKSPLEEPQQQRQDTVAEKPDSDTSPYFTSRSSLKERLGHRLDTATENGDSRASTSDFTSIKRRSLPVKQKGCEIELPKKRRQESPLKDLRRGRQDTDSEKEDSDTSSYFTSRSKCILPVKHNECEIKRLKLRQKSPLEEPVRHRQDTIKEKVNSDPSSYFTSRRLTSSHVKHKGCEVERPKPQQGLPTEDLRRQRQDTVEEEEDSDTSSYFTSRQRRSLSVERKECVIKFPKRHRESPLKDRQRHQQETIAENDKSDARILYFTTRKLPTSPAHEYTENRDKPVRESRNKPGTRIQECRQQEDESQQSQSYRKSPVQERPQHRQDKTKEKEEINAKGSSQKRSDSPVQKLAEYEVKRRESRSNERKKHIECKEQIERMEQIERKEQMERTEHRRQESGQSTSIHHRSTGFTSRKRRASPIEYRESDVKRCKPNRESPTGRTEMDVQLPRSRSTSSKEQDKEFRVKRFNGCQESPVREQHTSPQHTSPQSERVRLQTRRTSPRSEQKVTGSDSYSRKQRTLSLGEYKEYKARSHRKSSIRDRLQPRQVSPSNEQTPARIRECREYAANRQRVMKVPVRSQKIWKLSEITGNMTKLRGSEIIPTDTTLLSSTRVIVIADSNAKSVQRIPVGWELIAIGGLNMKRAGNIAKQISKQSMPILHHVVFAVGINDRDNSYADVRDCVEAVNVPDVQIHFQEIPHPPPNSVTKGAYEGIDGINKQANSIKGVRIIPLPDVVEFQNATSIHYIQSTVNAFVLGWTHHLNNFVEN